MEDREKTPEEMQAEQIKMNEMITESTNHPCVCGGVIFNVGLLTKILPAGTKHNPSEKEGYFDVPIKYCIKCLAPQDIGMVTKPGE